jgi:hypothetical protein
MRLFNILSGGGYQMPADEIKKFLEERDTMQLLAARDSEPVTRPVTRFARAHMSHNQTILAKWPELQDSTERVQAVRDWFEQLNPRIDQYLDEWFEGNHSASLRGEFVAAGFREAIANMLACDAARGTPQAKLWRNRFTARALEITEVLSTNIDSSLVFDELQRGIIIIITWGEHGAHFPDT